MPESIFKIAAKVFSRNFSEFSFEFDKIIILRGAENFRLFLNCVSLNLNFIYLDVNLFVFILRI